MQQHTVDNIFGHFTILSVVFSVWTIELWAGTVWKIAENDSKSNQILTEDYYIRYLFVKKLGLGKVGKN